MNKHDRKRFHKILQAEADGFRRLQNRGGIAIEYASEECERMTLAGQRELALVLVDRESRHLRDVEAALRRIQDGSFGTCVECEGQIPAKRLAAIPWASRCVRCQETADCGADWKEPSFDLFAA
jgi:DnaK suppressor protein